MTTDLVNIRLSRGANEVADKLVATGYFDYATTAAKFALAYALKNHFDEIDPETYSIPDSEGNNYNIGSIDSDGQLATLLRSLYPGTTTPYLYARALMVFGLTKLGERIESEGLQSISSFL
ncbi:MAG: hypothetical protein A4E53_03429 [Pelotomaculum sp. PtaB.Bin104]|nr:MAG: hypothetical protein A4E53_03429 [Pelotomaculum sp. PtaB.Bin104]